MRRSRYSSRPEKISSPNAEMRQKKWDAKARRKKYVTFFFPSTVNPYTYVTKRVNSENDRIYIDRIKEVVKPIWRRIYREGPRAALRTSSIQELCTFMIVEFENSRIGCPGFSDNSLPELLNCQILQFLAITWPLTFTIIIESS